MLHLVALVFTRGRHRKFVREEHDLGRLGKRQLFAAIRQHLLLGDLGVRVKYHPYLVRMERGLGNQKLTDIVVWNDSDSGRNPVDRMSGGNTALERFVIFHSEYFSINVWITVR